mmetsp:Transcript_17486/g.48657  ORF Transcript_17486/g.48657 Transcript_17486/m.48657 type:complete len:254 (-) Transcript_17486:1761-2522(-)
MAPRQPQLRREQHHSVPPRAPLCLLDLLRSLLRHPTVTAMVVAVGLMQEVPARRRQTQQQQRRLWPCGLAFRAATASWNLSTSSAAQLRSAQQRAVLAVMVLLLVSRQGCWEMQQHQQQHQHQYHQGKVQQLCRQGGQPEHSRARTSSSSRGALHLQQHHHCHPTSPHLLMTCPAMCATTGLRSWRRCSRATCGGLRSRLPAPPWCAALHSTATTSTLRLWAWPSAFASTSSAPWWPQGPTRCWGHASIRCWR